MKISRNTLGETNGISHIIYLENNKYAIIIPENNQNNYIVFSKFNNPGYYYNDQTYPHKYVRISLLSSKYIRPVDDDCNYYLLDDEKKMLMKNLQSPYSGYIFIDDKFHDKKDYESLWKYILDYIYGDTDTDIRNLKIPNYNMLN